MQNTRACTIKTISAAMPRPTLISRVIVSANWMDCQHRHTSARESAKLSPHADLGFLRFRRFDVFVNGVVLVPAQPASARVITLGGRVGGGAECQGK